MNVPKLRFKEFNDEWKSDLLQNISIITMGQSPNSNNYTDNPNDMLLIQGNADLKNGVVVPRLYTKQITKTCDINDIIMTVRAPVGDIAITSYKACIGRGVCSIKGNKFIYHYLDYLKNQDYWKKISKGSTIDSITSDDIRNLNIKTPSKNEMIKITHCIDLINKKIELQTKKIEDLKLFKKGILSNIFNNMKIIKQIKLGEIANISTGKLDANAMCDNGMYRFYTCAKNHYYIDTYAFNTEALLISGNGAYVGYIHYYKGKFNAYQRTYVLDNFKEDIFYIQCYLDSFLSKRINSEKKEGNTPYIVLSTLSEMKINIPDIKTQNQIVNISNNLDKKIDFEEKYLTKLKCLKKGLIQNIFV